MVQFSVMASVWTGNGAGGGKRPPRGVAARVVWNLAVGAVAAVGAISAASAADVPPLSARAAPEWTALFDAPFGTQPGWSGADGVYSLPLSGDERWGSGSGDARTLIWFGDTFVGGVNADGSRIGGTAMVNNTSALLVGREADASKLQFNVRRDSAGNAVAMIVPKKKKTWYWPMDGVTLRGKTYTYSLRMKTGTGGVFNFATDGVDLLSARAVDAVPYAGGYTRKALPLYAPAASDKRGETVFGVATLPLIKPARLAAPDGYLYVYGLRHDPLNKKLLVARVLPTQIGQAGAYRFWNGSAWVDQMSAAAPLANRMGAELSVIQVPDGRFMVVYQLDGISDQVAVRYAPTPTGPFGAPIVVWKCPEAGLTPNTYLYGAKAHPHLSAPGELLISYHVNTFDFWENFSAGGAAIYRPRFITLPMP